MPPTFPASPIYQGDGFEIGARWKEQVYYREGEQTHWFDAGWGRSPGTLYVPDAELWDRRVPDWMQGRRDEIMPRLVEHSRHLIEEDHARGLDGDGSAN